MEFSRPSRPDMPNSVPGPPDHAGHRPGDRRGQSGDPDKDQDRSETTRAMAGAVSPMARATTPARVMAIPQVKRPAQRDLDLALLIRDAATGGIRTARRPG